MTSPLPGINLCWKWFPLLVLFLVLQTRQVFGNQPPRTSDFLTTLVWPEDTPLDTVIGTISASDADGDSITFQTDTSDTASLVRLSSPVEMADRPGIKYVNITLIAKLDRDFAPTERKLYFTISDESTSIPAWITLFISDVNDVKPQFINLPYDVTIKEDTPTGTTIFSRTSAKDPDNGRGGSVAYTMESNAQAADEEYLTTFQINQYNGNITLLRPLNYEKHSYYQFKLTARDGEGLEGEPASFVVYVLDVQDSPPNFVNLPYSIQIDEDTAPGSSIQKVFAVDGDSGIPNTITYSFKSGDFEAFDIEADGVITIKTALDRDSDTMRNKGGVYAMIVQASEVVPPGQVNNGETTATTLVTITVNDVNDNAPTFNEQHYSATILENMQQDVPVAFQGSIMQVSDIDQGRNSHFMLTFQKNGQPFYDFAPLPQEIYSESSILIRVNNSDILDYEKNQRIVFEVVARELDTIEKRSSTATVTIDIEDMNDNAPVFNQTVYHVEVDENSPRNKHIAYFSASDKDSGEYGEVKYSLRGGNGRFSMTEDHGVLKVKGNIDRETAEQYYLTVEARDGGGLRTPAEIVVTVKDKNDNKPVFRRDDYEGIVREKDSEFIRPLKVEALDSDEANTPRSQVSYQIVEQSRGLSSNFSIDSTTGVITITDPLDFETLDESLNGKVVLKVEAADGGNPRQSSFVFVNITVEDVNDFSPVFTQREYSTNILENSTEGFVVHHVSAQDFDGTGPNNDFIYRIEGGALDKFRIDFQTGEVKVEKGANLDRETQDEYTLSLSAIDRGTPPLTGHSSLKIKLNDINDETPVFDPKSQRIDLNENTDVGKSVISFVASDQDLNSDLFYSFGDIVAFAEDEKALDVDQTGVKDYFNISSAMGVVHIKNTLDRETAERIILHVVVEDKNAQIGDQTATGTLTVVLLDFNDNAPRFIPSSIYKANVSEAESVQSIVLQVSATDADDNQAISYRIGAATVDAFVISGDGTIRLSSSLNRETHEHVTFEVIATDNGVVPQVATATVSILVLDTNDNKPIFERHGVIFDVSEDAAVGHVVANFTATDKDKGDYGTIFYTLTGPDSNSGSFEIDSTSGIVIVAQRLDREVKSEYRVEVEASDSPNHPQERRSTRSNAITFVITDIDDNPPVFKSVTPEKPDISESTTVGQTVATVLAEDLDDKTLENGRVRYSLTSDTNATQSNGASLFRIDEMSGVITSAVKLDGYPGFYYITVLATNRNGNHRAEKEIFIKVVDVNDDLPKFVKPSKDNAQAYVMENSGRGTSVFQLEAEDDDEGPNGEIRYFIVPSPTNNNDGSAVFEVDAITGIITTKRVLNAENQDRYVLKVKAQDLGVPNPYSTTLTMIIVVVDKNDHKPEFDGIQVPKEISMNEDRLECANVNLAVDKDLNSTFTVICYYLIGSELLNTFRMNTFKGELCLDQKLDRETTPNVNIVIMALEDCYNSELTVKKIVMNPSDNYPPMYSPSETAKLWIRIKVEDVNDNPPLFKRKDLALGVTRDTQFGKFILQLKNDVEDKDTSRWGIDYLEATSGFEAHPKALREELKNLGVEDPFKLFRNGSIKTNMYFKPQMSGYFTVNLRVVDKGGLSDTAKLRISLINNDQRLKVVFRLSVNRVGPIKDAVAQQLGQKIGYRIVVDSIQTHENGDGQAELAKTDMFIHGEDLKTNEVIPASRLLRLIDEKNELLIQTLNDFNVLQIVPTYIEELDDGVEDKLKMALILVSVVLGSICIILSVVLYYLYKRYQRKLKAATAMAYVNSGVEPNETDLYKSDIPGTNIHSYENANPIFLEKIMLESQEDGLNSLDDNAFMNESTFDEQEMTVTIVSPEAKTRHRPESYLQAVIDRHGKKTSAHAKDDKMDGHHGNTDSGQSDQHKDVNGGQRSRRDSGIEERSAGGASGRSMKLDYSTFDQVICELKDGVDKSGKRGSDAKSTDSLKLLKVGPDVEALSDHDDGSISFHCLDNASDQFQNNDGGHIEIISNSHSQFNTSSLEAPPAYSDFRNGLTSQDESRSMELTDL